MRQSIETTLPESATMVAETSFPTSDTRSHLVRCFDLLWAMTAINRRTRIHTLAVIVQSTAFCVCRVCVAKKFYVFYALYAFTKPVTYGKMEVWKVQVPLRHSSFNNLV